MAVFVKMLGQAFPCDVAKCVPLRGNEILPCIKGESCQWKEEEREGDYERN